MFVNLPTVIGASSFTCLFLATQGLDLKDASAPLLLFLFACMVFKAIWQRLEKKDKSVEEKVDFIYKYLISIKEMKECPRLKAEHHENKK